MSEKESLKKINKIRKVVRVGVPKVNLKLVGDTWFITEFDDAVEAKKNALNNILTLHEALNGFGLPVNKSAKFNAQDEVKKSKSNHLKVAEFLVNSTNAFRPLKDGGLDSLVKVMWGLYLLDQTLTGRSSPFYELYKGVVNTLTYPDSVWWFVLGLNRKATVISYQEWCANNFQIGSFIVTDLNNVSDFIVSWSESNKKAFYLSDPNTSKKNKGLKTYVNEVIKRTNSPFIFRFLLVHESSVSFVLDDVGIVLQAWKAILAKKKGSFLEEVQGFFWKLELVAEASESSPYPAYGIQVVLIFNEVYAVSNESKILSMIERAWSEYSSRKYGEKYGFLQAVRNDDHVRHQVYFTSKSRLTFIEKIQQMGVPGMVKTKHRMAAQETLCGVFNKKNQLAKIALNDLILYFSISDALFPLGIESVTESSVSKGIEEGKRIKGVNTYGRGQIHKKHSSRTVKTKSADKVFSSIPFDI